jgi:hypothetical protein
MSNVRPWSKVPIVPVNCVRMSVMKNVEAVGI